MDLRVERAGETVVLQTRLVQISVVHTARNAARLLIGHLRNTVVQTIPLTGGKAPTRAATVRSHDHVLRLAFPGRFGARKQQRAGQQHEQDDRATTRHASRYQEPKRWGIAGLGPIECEEPQPCHRWFHALRISRPPPHGDDPRDPCCYLFAVDEPIDLLEDFRRLVAGFEEAGLEYAIVGALALAVHGFPRATTDLDFLIRKETIESALAVAATIGYLLERDQGPGSRRSRAFARRGEA